MFGRFAPETVRKNSLNVRSSVLGVALSFFGFRRRRFCFFSRDKVQVVTGHPHTHAVVVFFLLFVPPRLVFRPFWPCVLSLGVFSGCHSGPRSVFGILLELARA